jgi:2,4-dienoyl-CoA reductase-like NADH-dependent reductase (Old Yellow Enzyme family)
MSRYFKFHSLDDLRAECSRLSLDLRFSDDLSPLFRPVSVGPLRAGNSLCIQPMEGCDGTLDGRPDELTFRRYRRFGAGGAKLIWGEATAVLEEARANPRQLLLNEHTAPDFERLLSECRQAHREVFGTDDDLIVGLQLTHSGRYSYHRPLIAFHDPLLDPRTIVDKATGKTVDRDYPLVSDDYLARLIEHYVAAARLALRIGFQFVDIKQCHRYLLSELLAAKTRPGRYGGSLENRTRLAREIVERIKAEVPGLMIATRLNVYDGIPFQKPPTLTLPHKGGGISSPLPRGMENELRGSSSAFVGERENALPSSPSPLVGEGGGGGGEPCPFELPVRSAWGTREHDPLQPDLTEPTWWIGEMHRLGVSLVNISMGNPYATMHVIRPFEYPPPDGYAPPEHPLVGVDRQIHLAGQLQQAFPQVPMAGSGYSYLQEYLFHAGAANIRDGRITFVGVGRAALPQPDFARQLLEHGRLERTRVCRTFSYCTALMRAKHNALGQFATGCPPFDKEVYGPIWQEAKKT